MPKTLRAVIDALMPKGPIWSPVSGGDFDNLLEFASTTSGDDGSNQTKTCLVVAYDATQGCRSEGS